MSHSPSRSALVLAAVTAATAAAFAHPSRSSGPALAASPNASSAPAQRPGQPPAATALKILVLDNAPHGLAVAAAATLGSTTVASPATFNALLTSQAWDVVAVDSTNALDLPGGGWAPLAAHANAGGRAVASFWDWDHEDALAAAFDVQVLDVAVLGELDLNGSTLHDSGTSPAFLGVAMPNSSWHQHAGDDGDRFVPLSGAQPLAHAGDPAQPVMVRGNAGRTIAAPLLSEAGDAWIADGSGVRLWRNLLRMVADTSGPNLLVYDQNTHHHLAQQAAFEHSPGTTHVAKYTTFDALLQTKAWDAVLIDCPGALPIAGWGALIQYVNEGGRVVLALWDWDNDLGHGHPDLPAAFDVALAGDLDWTGLTLFDSGLTDVFQGVTMPISTWSAAWDDDDGDRFHPLPPARGLAHVGNPTEPVLVWGNAGRTIAAPRLDEAGPPWLFDQSGVQLWSNLLALILGPDPACAFRNGLLGLNPSDYTCVVPPALGGTWTASVATTPLLGTTTLATVVTLGHGGPAQGIPLLGFELLVLPPWTQAPGFGTHLIPVPSDPLLAGLPVASQAARIELGFGGTLHVVLTNAQDVVLGI